MHEPARAALIGCKIFVYTQAFEDQLGALPLFSSSGPYECGVAGDERITVVILKVGGYKVLEGSPVGLAYFVPAPLPMRGIRRARGRKKAILLAQNDLQRLWSG